MVALIEMNHEEFTNWNERIWIAYRSELIKSGSTEVEAEQNVQLNISQTMPEGIPLPGNYILNVVENEKNIGVVWVCDRDSKWFIYDIEIDEHLRGQGLGRATMRAIEEFVKGKGGSEISLSVFGFNEVARKLYETEGYETTRLAMTKKLV
jgi:ribosomal protein S18 acetylase RimI-like enzyme